MPSYNPRARRFPPPWTAEDNGPYEPEPRDARLCVLPMVDLCRRWSHALHWPQGYQRNAHLTGWARAPCGDRRIRINNQRDRLDDDSLQPCRYWASSSRLRKTMFGAEFHDASRSLFQGIRSASQDEVAATAITGVLCVVTPSSRRCLTQKSSSTVHNIGCCAYTLPRNTTNARSAPAARDLKRSRFDPFGASWTIFRLHEAVCARIIETSLTICSAGETSK